jgi:hypothetical protein
MPKQCCVFECKSIRKGSKNQNTFHNFPTVTNKIQIVETGSQKAMKCFQSLKYSCVKHFKGDSEDTALIQNVVSCRVLRYIAHPSLFSKKVNGLPFMSTKNISLEPFLSLVWVKMPKLESDGSKTLSLKALVFSQTAI